MCNTQNNNSNLIENNTYYFSEDDSEEEDDCCWKCGKYDHKPSVELHYSILRDLINNMLWISPVHQR
jgi:hypothetical protein